MPLYEYECQKCGHRFERIQKFSDAPVKKCPECRGRVEQLLSAPAVQFKGSGWYVTDYASKGAKAGESADGAGKSKEAGEAKPGQAGEKAAASEKSEAKSDAKGKAETAEKPHGPRRGHARR